MKIAVVSFCLFFSSMLCLYSSSAYCKDAISKVCFKNACVNAEIADSDEKRIKGLMFRKSLPDDFGMLFVFKHESRYSFWMKNMSVPLDVIWISRDMKIVEITKNVPPCSSSCESIVPQVKAMFVVEVASGFADRNSIEVGEDVCFK